MGWTVQPSPLLPEGKILTVYCGSKARGATAVPAGSSTAGFVLTRRTGASKLTRGFLRNGPGLCVVAPACP